MKLAALTTLTMIAFAANSLLNRAALSGGDIGPGTFAAIRVTSGVVMLLLLLTITRRQVPKRPKPNLTATAALAAYILGFSYAYTQLHAGLGALILFGGVQVTMFAGALIQGDRPPIARWLGMVVSLAGLGALTWPSGAVPTHPTAFALMGVAAVGWGIYSLIGRGATDPLAATTWNFAYALPIAAITALLAMGEPVTAKGITLAILSGAVTSGLGYALWYAVLPALGATRAAVAQLSVPVIAIAAGALILSEPITARAVLASALILGGIALGLTGSRGSRI